MQYYRAVIQIAILKTRMEIEIFLDIVCEILNCDNSFGEQYLHIYG